MTQEQTPLERFYDLDDLGRAGAEVAIEPGPEDRARLAKWAEVESVDTFRADISLSRLSTSRFRLEAVLHADIVQTCVATLEPVRSHIHREFSRELHLTSAPHRHKAAASGASELALGAADDEAPEDIESPHFDLAGPVLEEFVLAIDPYPRAPGATFAALEEPSEAKESPFAALKALKGRR